MTKFSCLKFFNVHQLLLEQNSFLRVDEVLRGLALPASLPVTHSQPATISTRQPQLNSQLTADAQASPDKISRV